MFKVIKNIINNHKQLQILQKENKKLKELLYKQKKLNKDIIKSYDNLKNSKVICSIDQTGNIKEHKHDEFNEFNEFTKDFKSIYV